MSTHKNSFSRDQARAYHPAIWTPDDFDQTVRDAQAVVEAGKRRLRVVGEDERGLPAFLFTTSRERRARRMDALAVALLMAVAAAFGVILMLLAAPTAKADNVSDDVLDYVSLYGEGAVCPVISEHYSVNGLLGVMIAIRDDGFSDYETGQIVGLSVSEYCPENYPLLEMFMARYGDKDSLA